MLPAERECCSPWVTPASLWNGGLADKKHPTIKGEKEIGNTIHSRLLIVQLWLNFSLGQPCTVLVLTRTHWTSDYIFPVLNVKRLFGLWHDNIFGNWKSLGIPLCRNFWFWHYICNFWLICGLSQGANSKLTVYIWLNQSWGKMLFLCGFGSECQS